MKVIVAAHAKTGTTSICAALQQLGYCVYDFLEHYTEHGDDWTKIFKEGGTTKDFRRMYENVDAVTDSPACLFWDEIHKAFPDAKIIVCVRSSEEEWFESFKNQLEMFYCNWKVRSLVFSPSYRRYTRYLESFLPFLFGYYFSTNGFSTYKFNPMLMKMKYRRHNANVLQNAPKDKLLVFNVKQGWKPLCDFLGIEVPKTPFPHKNVRGEAVGDFFDHPMFNRMKWESRISMLLICSALTYGGYKLAKGSWYRFGIHFFSAKILPIANI